MKKSNADRTTLFVKTMTEMNNMLRVYLRKTYRFIVINFLYRFMRLFSERTDVILFESFLGATVDGNVLEILLELQQRTDKKYLLVWSKRRSSNLDLTGCLMVNRFSPKYFYYVSVAKYIVNNSRMPDFYIKRPGQVYVQTWHGTPLKKLVYDMENVAMPNADADKYLNEFSRDVAKWDILFSQNHYSTEIFKTAFRYSGQIMQYGYPRNKQLHDQRIDLNKVRQELKIGPTNRVILYTPTYRENNHQKDGRYRQDIAIDFEHLLNRVDNVTILVRAHYLVAKMINFDKYDQVIDVSTYENINDLYLIADAMITDYSSTMFDYSVLRKPMIFYAYDLEMYQNELRGFYLDYNKLPGAKITQTEQLIEILNNFISYQEQYADAINQFNQKFILSEEHCATKRYVDEIFY